VFVPTGNSSQQPSSSNVARLGHGSQAGMGAYHPGAETSRRDGCCERAGTRCRRPERGRVSSGKPRLRSCQGAATTEQSTDLGRGSHEWFRSRNHTQATYNAAGRWPANVVHDGSDEVESAFAAFGDRPGQLRPASSDPDSPRTRKVYGKMDRADDPMTPRGDTGTASRFFYSAKAGKEDRAGSKHPTVKPVALIRWLVR